MKRRDRGYWVPHTCVQLREVLREMGITRVNGRPLSRVRKRQLYAVFFRIREQKRGQDESIHSPFATDNVQQ